VALSAVHGRVRARETEPAQVVVEPGSLPDAGGMARVALGGEVQAPVIGIGCLLKRGKVAPDALRRRAGIAAGHVAGVATRAAMRARKREPGRSGVVENAAFPRSDRVAQGAIPREAGVNVPGIPGGIEITEMATLAVGRRPLKAARSMAGRARGGPVSSGQLESGIAVVVETSAAPRIHAMARFASEREPGRLVVHCLCLLVVAEVTRGALGAEAGVDAAGRAAMAGVAVHGCMSAQKREPVRVLANGLDRRAPPSHRVALFTVRAELAAMEIGVAVRALSPGAGKDFSDVAGSAGDVHVHAAQRKSCFLVVVEFRLSPQRRPPGGRVAVLAGESNRSVGVARRSPAALSGQM